MAELLIPSRYDDERIPAQGAFRRSRARVRGYGGAMGGGKSFALCQEAFDWMLDYPGITLPIFRQKHTAITNTTRKTFLEQVLPAELRERPDLVRVKASSGEDLVEFLWSGSTVHFVGLDDPGKWFSSEIGGAMFDEAHEIDEQDVLTINSRLRQRCRDCVAKGDPDCAHMPRGIVLAFNPSYPGHWLQNWCILGGARTEYGWRKDELIPTDGDASIGDLEFFISRATDNPFLPPGYIENALAGMPPAMRRRYLEGMWEHISGSGFFDQQALTRLVEDSILCQPVLVGETAGDTDGAKELPRLVQKRGAARLEVFKAPVRLHVDKQTEEEVQAHRYVLGIDTSSGAGADFSGVQAIDVDSWEQAAEWQGKIDPDKLAIEAFRLACVYNGALLVPEITGGWGFAVVKKLQELIRDWKGPARARPKLYTRPITGRISDRFTDMLGWDTTQKTRALALATLEEGIRDGSFTIHGQRTLAELAAFAFPEYKGTGDYGKPQARKGQHDDLVMAIAIGLAVSVKQPKKLAKNVDLVMGGIS